MSGKKLGRGLDSLLGKVKSEEVISGAVKSEIVEVNAEKAGEVITDTVKSEKVISEKFSLSESIIEKAIAESRANPRVILWSIKASALLRFLKKTIPEFSISEVAAEILEEGLRKRYPELWEAVEKRLD